MKYNINLHGPIPRLFAGEYPDEFSNPSKLCTKKNWMGTLYEDDHSKMNCLKYRTRYLPRAVRLGHIAITPFAGIRYAINRWTKPGDIVLDPFAGSGTTLYEACLFERKAIGIEFEFPDITRLAMEPFKTGWELYPGDALEELDKVKNESIALVNLSNPYPKGGDKNQKILTGKMEKSKNGKEFPDVGVFDYKKEGNLGLLTGDGYWDKMTEIHAKVCSKVKKGGHVVFVIKDTMKKREIVPLHEKLASTLPDSMEFIGTYCAPHYPTTLFMNTYPKRFPGVPIPREQISPVFRKRK